MGSDENESLQAAVNLSAQAADTLPLFVPE
jgi:hypothetical protein